MPSGALDLQQHDGQGFLPCELAIQHNNAMIVEVMAGLKITDNNNNLGFRV